MGSQQLVTSTGQYHSSISDLVIETAIKIQNAGPGVVGSS